MTSMEFFWNFILAIITIVSSIYIVFGPARRYSVMAFSYLKIIFSWILVPQNRQLLIVVLTGFMQAWKMIERLANQNGLNVPSAQIAIGGVIAKTLDEGLKALPEQDAKKVQSKITESNTVPHKSWTIGIGKDGASEIGFPIGKTDLKFRYDMRNGGLEFNSNTPI